MFKENYIYEFGGLRKKGFFTRKYYIKKDSDFEKKKAEYIKNCNNTDVYQCMYGYENEDIDHCKIISDLYLDFDADNIQDSEVYKKLVDEVLFTSDFIKKSLKVPENKYNIFFSGSKGFHIVIPHEILGLKPAAELNKKLKFFALGIIFLRHGKNIQECGNDFLDIAIYDRKRLFRVPNTINSKSGLYKVPVSPKQLSEFSYENMVNYAKEPHEYNEPICRLNNISHTGYIETVENGKEYDLLKNGRVTGRKHFVLKEGEKLPLLPCAKYLLENGAAKGCRNMSLFALSSSLLQSGEDTENVIEIVKDWNNNKCDEPLDEREVNNTIESALSSFNNGMIVGCGKYKDLDLCLPDCYLNTRKRE